MPWTNRWIPRAWLLVVALGATSASAAPFFTPLGFANELIEDPYSEALGVSRDGSIVVGRSSTDRNDLRAVRWTAEEGLVPQPGVLISGDNGVAYGVSDDGSVLVGRTRDRNGSQAQEGAVWRNGEVTPVGVLPADRVFSELRAVSADGTVAVGTSASGSDFDAVLWTEEGGLVSLGAFPGYGSKGAFDVSADGRVVVGGAERADGAFEAFRWTEEGGFEGLGFLPGQSPAFSDAYAASSNGETVVGTTYLEGDYVAMRWTRSGGMESLGLPEGDWGWGYAVGVSANGQSVVGWLQTASEYDDVAFLWTASEGIRTLASVFDELALEHEGWSFEQATAISDDGRTIVGTGINPSGHYEGFLLYVPEPPAVVLAALAAGHLLGLSVPRRGS